MSDNSRDDRTGPNIQGSMSNNTADEGSGLFSGARSREILREGGYSEDEIEAVHSGAHSEKHAEVADSGLADIVVAIRDSLNGADSLGGETRRTGA